jgi:hypothetical protein
VSHQVPARHDPSIGSRTASKVTGMNRDLFDHMQDYLHIPGPSRQAIRPPHVCSIQDQAIQDRAQHRQSPDVTASNTRLS